MGRLEAAPIDINYAGGERWSPDHRRIALFRFDGTVTVISLVEPESQQQTTFDTPGVVDVAWAADGRHLAVARQDAGSDSVAVDLMDVSTAMVDRMRTFTREGVAPEAPVQLHPAPDGSRISDRSLRSQPEPCPR